MIATITPTPTTLSDALAIIGMCIPAAFVLHAIVAMSMVRKARAGDPAAAEVLKKHLWSVPALLLAWGPFLVMSLGVIGCLLLRDRGYLIFPWSMIAVFGLFAPLRELYQVVLRRRLKRLMGEVAL